MSEPSSGADLAPIATKILYEDEYVRVWNQVVPAGATLPKHKHEHDYYLVNVRGEGPFQVDFLEGTGGALGERFTYRPKPGTADLVPKGHVEIARNDGEEYRAILVELKQR
jgi:hypothetical protein